MWEDQKEPFVMLDIDDAEYDVNVSNKIPSKQQHARRSLGDVAG
jgi:hypothetical protein